MLDKKKKNEIKNRCLKATEGPWTAYVEGRDHTSGSSFIKTPNGDIEIFGATEYDYDFIAHSRDDIPMLIEEIEKLTEELKKLKNNLIYQKEN